ncbi:MAG TPA: M20/M25/M40 family metallo-hydrolase [Vicinamibacterales bacterium]|nr:M20/M25/M40 family metallo-hydrolase [Vicinamibacterales bacterium]
MHRIRLAVLFALLASPAFTQSADVSDYVRRHQGEIVRELLALVAIPNHRADLPNIKRNAELLRQMLERRGMKPEVWDTPTAPLVYGERLVPGATRTILFYIHFDGQPVDKAAWKQDDPFKPIVRAGSLEEGAAVVTDVATRESFPDNYRVYARSAGDDKGPIQAFVSAMDAIGSKPSQNIKLILHGEEEGGGPSLDYAIKNHAEKLRSDVLIIVDGPQHPSNKPTIYYGARGGAGLEVTVYTAKSGMHSGNYGNWLPDANVRLTQLISSMFTPAGKVAIDGFYDDVLPFPAAAVQMMTAVPDVSDTMRQQYGLGSTDGAASSLQEGLNLPAFSVHMMKGGEVGGVIAASATAEIALRLVKENSPRVMVDRILAHIRKQGYFIVDKDPDTATMAAHPRIAKVTTRANAESGAWRTDPDLPAVKFIADALRARYGDNNVVRIRTLGGGIPAGAFINAFQVPTVGISLANYDDNQHTDNENLRLGHLWKGIETLAALMTHR